MADSTDQWGFKNERSKKRRHSYSSARAFAARPLPTKAPLTPKHSLTSSLRGSKDRNGRVESVHQTSATHSHESEITRGGRRKSFVGFFRSKAKKKRNLSSPLLKGSSASHRSSTSSLPSQDRMQASDLLVEQKGEFVRVIATELHPQIHYKTLPITQYTTVYEVIVKLVGKYAYSMEDQNPDGFYITEVRESEQGSYSRVLENSDRMFEIQSRWQDGKKCSFILCRKEIFKVGDDPFLENPIDAMVLSPSQDSFYSGFPGMVDVEVPSTPTSPNSYNAKSSFFDDFYSSTDTHASHGPLQSSILPISPSELSENEVFMVSKQPTNSPKNEAVAEPKRRPTKKKESSASSKVSDVNKLMQQSVSEGMLGIMTKVVKDSKQKNNSPLVNKTRSRQRRATVSPSSSPAKFARKDGEQVILRQLVYSPSESAEKKFPELIFTPKETERSPLSHELGDGDLDVAKRLQFEAGNGYNEHKKSSKLKDFSARSHTSKNIFPHFRTSHSLPIVKFENTCVIYPKYRCSASIYPSFSRNTRYKTQMDMTHSLSSMLEDHLMSHSELYASHTSEIQEDNCFDQSTAFNENKPSTQSKLKRPHTFHVRRDHLQLHNLNQDSEESSLLTRDHLVERAALAIRQRHSSSSSRLSEGEYLPRHLRLGSTSSNLSRRGSTTSVSSEVESDLDALLDLQSKRLSTCSATSEQSLTAIQLRITHSRADSDGLFQVGNRRTPRLRRESSNDSNSSIQTQGAGSQAMSSHYPLRGTSRSNSQSKVDTEASYFLRASRSSIQNAHQDSITPTHGFNSKRMYKSVEAINTAAYTNNNAPVESNPDEGNEVLYTFQSNFRPITVLVRSKSTLTLQETQSTNIDMESEQKVRATKSSVNLHTEPDKSLAAAHLREEKRETYERTSSALGGRKEIWTFSKRRSQRKVKSWYSEL